MKTLWKPTVVLIVMAIVISAFTLNAETSSASQDLTQSDYVIISYVAYATNNKATITIHYGGTKYEEIQLTKEQINNTIANNVADLLSKFNSQGYTLVSTAGVGPNLINCYLKKTNK